MKSFKMKNYFNFTITFLAITLATSSLYAEAVDGDSENALSSIELNEPGSPAPLKEKIASGKTSRLQPNCNIPFETIQQNIRNQILTMRHHLKIMGDVMSPKQSFEKMLNSKNEATYNDGELDISTIIHSARSEYRVQLKPEDYPKLTSPLALAQFVTKNQCTAKQ